jgi:poly(glycerol-phosphate) alpha-glucosyltransferase
VSEIALPDGHHYALTQDIRDHYAGMTVSLLHRSRAFVELTGAEVTIVTFKHRDDWDPIRKRLRARGAMVEGMHLVNLWEDLRGWDDEKLKQAAPTFAPGAESTFDPLGERGDHANPLRSTLHDKDNGVLQVDYFRVDGTLLASDRRNVPGDNRRAITLCDRSGSPLGTWRRARHLHWAWLDSLPRDPIAWFICDSKTIANHLLGYHRDDAVTIHVVHGSHRQMGSSRFIDRLKPSRRRSRRPMGKLKPSRRHIMEHLDEWDGVVFLTRQQLDEVDVLFGPGTNRQVIPHGQRVPKALPNIERPSSHGVMLTRLTPRKQINHAIKAMSRLRRAGFRQVTLDVWGEGPERKKLLLAIRLRSAAVRLRGYSASAPAEFDKASFSLVTSDNEAFALVIGESMSRGCIPISYDMPYGPGEIITHGVDGFLVAPGDVSGLAAQIREIASSTPAELAPIRRAAHRRAIEYSDEHVTERWGSFMNAIERRRAART